MTCACSSHSWLGIGLLFLAGWLYASGCESDVAAPTDEHSLETRNALDILPADARMVGAFDVTAAQDNAAVADVIDGISGSEAGPRADAFRHFSEFMEMTGFNPAADLDRVYLATNPIEGQQPEVAIVAYASYDKNRMDRYVSDHHAGAFTTDEFEGTTLYSHRKEDEAIHFAFVNNELILASTATPRLETMLVNLRRAGHALSSNETVMNLVRRVPNPGGAWMVVQRPFEGPTFSFSSDPKGDNARRLAPMIEDVVAGAEFKPNGIEVTTITTTQPGYDAEDVADLMRGLVATARGAAKDDDRVMKTLDSIRIRDRGSEVHINLFLDVESIRDR